MTNVLLIIQLLVAIGLTVVILLQKSEGGALGMGGGGAGGGMMSGRSAANILTRTTMVLAALFILNCIALAVLTGVDASGRSVFDREVETAPAIVEEVEEEAGQIPTDG
jgi:preprotein translocase subunit SecG